MIYSAVVLQTRTSGGMAIFNRLPIERQFHPLVLFSDLRPRIGYFIFGSLMRCWSENKTNNGGEKFAYNLFCI